MDKYNSKIAKFLAFINRATNYAITLDSETTLYSCPPEIVRLFPRWIKHENYHKVQYTRFSSKYHFWWAYIKESVRHGYYNNKFEVEARYHEGF